MAGVAGEADDLIPGTTLAGLFDRWENDEVIRGQALKCGGLLQWPDQKSTGVITFSTMSINARVLRHLLELWCPQVSEAKTVNIDQLREQDGWHKKSSVTKIYFQTCYMCVVMFLICK